MSDTKYIQWFKLGFISHVIHGANSFFTLLKNAVFGLTWFPSDTDDMVISS